MAFAAQAPASMTIEQFVAFLNGEPGDRRWELIDGVARLMAGSSEHHAQIVMNIGSRLYSAMRERGCRAYQGDILVRNPERDDMTTLPDVAVTCGTPGNRRFIDDQVAVVEVLSPFTMEFDRGYKLSFYKDHPTIRHIAVAYQDECRVEAFHRTEEGWRLEVLRVPGDRLRFEAIGFSLGLDAVYDGVRFEES